MGRYYTLINTDGKFAFGVQPSDDAVIFGMEECEPTSIDYHLEDSAEAREEIIRVLDQQYDILGTPKKKRIYEYDKALGIPYDLLDRYIYRICEKDKLPKNVVPYAGGTDWYKLFLPEDQQDMTEKEFDEKYCIIPKKEGTVLAGARIALGLKILYDLEKEGYCDLNAEL